MSISGLIYCPKSKSNRNIKLFQLFRLLYDCHASDNKSDLKTMLSVQLSTKFWDYFLCPLNSRAPVFDLLREAN